MTETILRRLPATIVFLVLLSTTPCLAQQTNSRKIDAYVTAEMRRQKIPGVSLAVVRNGKIELLRSYGFSNVEHQVPVKPETIFQSGSIGKQFTATAIMILVEEGKLALDDKLRKFFPDGPSNWDNITVRHLLTHTSGMGDYPPDLDLRRDLNEDEYLAIIKSAPLSFAPGSKWDYSNLGYVTLGILIRKVTGKYYGDFLNERVFLPLGMTTARVISEADIVPNRAAGYRLLNGELKNQEWVSPSTNSTADGSLYLSILDLAKWDAALYTDNPLKQSSLVQMWTPVELSDGSRKPYGFAWHTETVHHRRMVFHGGAWQGFKSFIVRFPDEKLSIIYFANQWNTRDFKFTRGLIATFYPEFALPALTPIEDKEPQVTALVRRVLLQLANGKADPELFTPAARAKLFPDEVVRIERSLNSFSLPVAVIHTNELIGRTEQNGLRVYRYLLTDPGRSLISTVALTADNKIASIEISTR